MPEKCKTAFQQIKEKALYRCHKTDFDSSLALPDFALVYNLPAKP